MSAADTVITGSLLLAIAGRVRRRRRVVPVALRAAARARLPVVHDRADRGRPRRRGRQLRRGRRARARDRRCCRSRRVALTAAPRDGRCGTGPVGCSPAPCCSSSGSPWCSCRTGRCSAGSATCSSQYGDDHHAVARRARRSCWGWPSSARCPGCSASGASTARRRRAGGRAAARRAVRPGLDAPASARRSARSSRSRFTEASAAPRRAAVVRVLPRPRACRSSWSGLAFRRAMGAIGWVTPARARRHAHRRRRCWSLVGLLLVTGALGASSRSADARWAGGRRRRCCDGRAGTLGRGADPSTPSGRGCPPRRSRPRPGRAARRRRLAALGLAPAHQHAHRADPAVPAGAGRGPRLAAAAARAERRTRSTSTSPTTRAGAGAATGSGCSTSSARRGSPRSTCCCSSRSSAACCRAAGSTSRALRPPPPAAPRQPGGCPSTARTPPSDAARRSRSTRRGRAALARAGGSDPASTGGAGDGRRREGLPRARPATCSSTWRCSCCSLARGARQARRATRATCWSREGAGFADTVPQYDSFTPGRLSTAATLPPFSFTLDEFSATTSAAGSRTVRPRLRRRRHVTRRAGRGADAPTTSRSTSRSASTASGLPRRARLRARRSRSRTGTGQVVFHDSVPFLPQDGDVHLDRRRQGAGHRSRPARRCRAFFLPTAAVDAEQGPTRSFPRRGQPAACSCPPSAATSASTRHAAVGLPPRHHGDRRSSGIQALRSGRVLDRCPTARDGHLRRLRGVRLLHGRQRPGQGRRAARGRCSRSSAWRSRCWCAGAGVGPGAEGRDDGATVRRGRGPRAAREHAAVAGRGRRAGRRARRRPPDPWPPRPRREKENHVTVNETLARTSNCSSTAPWRSTRSPWSAFTRLAVGRSRPRPGGDRRRGAVRRRPRRRRPRSPWPPWPGPPGSSAGHPAPPLPPGRRGRQHRDAPDRLGDAAARRRRPAARAGGRPAAVGQHVRVLLTAARSPSRRVPSCVLRCAATCAGSALFVAGAGRCSRSARRHLALHRRPPSSCRRCSSYWLVDPRDRRDHLRRRLLRRRRRHRALPGRRRARSAGTRQGRPVRWLPSPSGCPAAAGSTSWPTGSTRSCFPLWTFADHRRRDLGRGRLGPLLGLGPQGDLGVHHLGRVRRLPARPRDRRLEGPQGRVPRAGRLRRASIFNYYGVNIFLGGLHSYSGLN